MASEKRNRSHACGMSIYSDHLRYPSWYKSYRHYGRIILRGWIHSLGFPLFSQGRQHFWLPVRLRNNPFWKRVNSKRIEFAPTGSKFFPFEQTSLQKRSKTTWREFSPLNLYPFTFLQTSCTAIWRVSMKPKFWFSFLVRCFLGQPLEIFD